MSKQARVIELPPVTQEKDWPEYVIHHTGFIEANLKGEDRRRLKQLHADLVLGGRFADGRPIQSKADVLRWLLEQADLSGKNGSGREGREGREKTA